MKQLTTLLTLMAALSGSAQGLRIIAVAERNDALYKVDEKIKFNISLIQTDAAEAHKDPLPENCTLLPGIPITWELRGDGNLHQTGVITSGIAPLTIETSLPRPGFLLLKLTATSAEKTKLTRYAAAAVEPLALRSGTSAPPDFDHFWHEKIKELRSRTPLVTTSNITVNPQQNAPATIDVRIDDGTVAATGILTLPPNATSAAHPAIISFGGASSLGAKTALNEATSYSAIIFHMNIHDSENTIAPEQLAAVRQRPGIAGYYRDNADSLDDYIPITVFLRIVRALDYLKSRPEWNGKQLIASGASFGGCQAIVAAALDCDVTLCLAGAPAMCDHLGERNQQNAGWPHLLKQRQYNDDPDKRQRIIELSPYYDAANFARRIHCEAIFSAGFLDTVCPPTSVYAAYNNLATTNKQMINAPTAAHGGALRPGDPGGFDATSHKRNHLRVTAD